MNLQKTLYIAIFLVFRFSKFRVQKERYHTIKDRTVRWLIKEGSAEGKLGNRKTDLALGDKVLILLATNHFIPKQAISCLSINEKSVLKAISRLLDEKLIKETNRIYSIRYDSHTHPINVSLFSITWQGMKYLSKKEFRKNTSTYNCYGRWIDFLPSNIEKLEVFPSGINSEEIIGHSDIGTGALIAFLMDASYSPCFIRDQKDILLFDDGDSKNTKDDLAKTNIPTNKTELPVEDNEQNKSHRLKEIVWNALMECEPQYEICNGHYFIGNNKEKIRFVNRKICKQIYRESGTSDIKIQYGTYAGIFDGPYFASLIYILPRRGMHWGQYMRDKEFYSYRYYMSKHSQTPTHKNPAEQTPVYAALFVKNEQMFKSIFCDTKKRREKAIKKIGKDPLGEGLASFVVFPVNYHGIMAYKEYLLHPPDYSRQMVLKLGIESGYYYENPNNILTLPLIDADGIEYFEGSVIDIIHLKRLVNLLDDNPNRAYKIICYKWQAEYYIRILPDAQFSFLD